METDVKSWMLEEGENVEKEELNCDSTKTGK